jgi:hypothetical protein
VPSLDRPWSLAEKFDEAERMAKAGCSVQQIISVTALTPDTAESIKERHNPDFNSFERLKKNRKDE